MRHDNDNKKPPAASPVVETEPGTPLFETWVAALPRHDPALAEDAVRIITESSGGVLPPFQGLSEEQARQEALRWAWVELVDIDSPQAQARLRGVPGVASGVPRERLMLEVRVRAVLAKLAAEVLSGTLELVATHPREHIAFHPDPAPLAHLTGPERSRGELPSEWGAATNIRFHDGKADPRREPELPPPKTREEFLRSLKAQGITPGDAGQISWQEASNRAKNETHKGTKGSPPINCAGHGEHYSASSVSAFA